MAVHDNCKWHIEEGKVAGKHRENEEPAEVKIRNVLRVHRSPEEIEDRAESDERDRKVWQFSGTSLRRNRDDDNCSRNQNSARNHVEERDPFLGIIMWEKYGSKLPHCGRDVNEFSLIK